MPVVMQGELSSCGLLQVWFASFLRPFLIRHHCLWVRLTHRIDDYHYPMHA